MGPHRQVIVRFPQTDRSGHTPAPSRFDVAAARVMQRYTPDEWMLLGAKQRTASIYAELARLDADHARAQEAIALATSRRMAG